MLLSSNFLPMLYFLLGHPLPLFHSHQKYLHLHHSLVLFSGKKIIMYVSLQLRKKFPTAKQIQPAFDLMSSFVCERISRTYCFALLNASAYYAESLFKTPSALMLRIKFLVHHQATWILFSISSQNVNDNISQEVAKNR